MSDDLLDGDEPANDDPLFKRGEEVERDDLFFKSAAGFSDADDELFHRPERPEIGLESEDEEQEAESPAEGNWLQRVITTPLRAAFRFVFGPQDEPDETSAVVDDDDFDDFFGERRK